MYISRVQMREINKMAGLVGSTNCSQFNGGCSHVCLPNPQGRQCFCPEGVQLKPGDPLTCQGGKVLRCLMGKCVFFFFFQMYQANLDTIISFHVFLFIDQSWRFSLLFAFLVLPLWPFMRYSFTPLFRILLVLKHYCM